MEGAQFSGYCGAMPEQDNELVHRIYERWNRNDGDLAVDVMAPEVEVRQMARVFDTAGTFKGHEGLLLAAKELGDAWETIEWVAEREKKVGDWLVVSLRAVVAGRYSGVESQIGLVHAWRVRDGLVTDLRVYEKDEQALEDVALSK